MHPSKTVLALIVPCLLAGVAAACSGQPDDPAERVSEIRSRYAAKLNGFAVDQLPRNGEEASPEPMAGAEDGVPAGAADEEGAGEAEAMEAVPVRQDAILDILVSQTGRESLPGITVDIEHVGPKPERAVKQVYRAYLDTTDVHRGPGTQIVHRLEDVDYVEGDGFHVEVRHPIPPGERSEYREFQEAGEGS